MAQGHEIAYDDAHREINAVAGEHGFLTGVPIPLLDDVTDMVMAKGLPLAEILRLNQTCRHLRTEAQID